MTAHEEGQCTVSRVTLPRGFLAVGREVAQRYHVLSESARRATSYCQTGPRGCAGCRWGRIGRSRTLDSHAQG